MRNLLKYIFTAIVSLVVAYIGFFLIWVMFTVACISNADIKGTQWQSCGDNTMTHIAQKIYSPIFEAYEEEK